MAFNDIQCTDVNALTVEGCTFADTSGAQVFFRGATTSSYSKIDPDVDKQACELSKFRILYANSIYITRVDEIKVLDSHFHDIGYGGCLTIVKNSSTIAEVRGCRFDRVVDGMYLSQGKATMQNCTIKDSLCVSIGAKGTLTLAECRAERIR